LTVFVDTSTIFAVLDRADQNHVIAIARLEHLVTTGAVLVTSNYVVVESCALLQRRLGKDALQTFRNDVLPSLVVQWVNERQHEIAFATLIATDRRRLSLVDCVSFRVMRDLNLQMAFAFDGHFDEEGFDCKISSIRER
jgi:predicted nucleic acid-binding protein